MNNKTLPLGRFTKKQGTYTTIIMLFTIVVYYMIITLLHNIISSFALCLVLGGIPMIFVSLSMFMLIDPMLKLNRKFNNDLDFNYYESKIFEFKGNNIHSESNKYLDLMLYNYMNLVDLNKANRIYERITEPQFRNYKYTYDLLGVMYAINNDNYKLAIENLEEFKQLYPRKSKQIKNLEMLIKVYLTDEVIDNVLDLYKVENVNKINKVLNASALLHYYQKRNDIEKARHYAKILLDNATTLPRLINIAKKIVE